MPDRPVLLFAYGNISRGDDALAPLLLEKLQQQGLTRACSHPIRFLTDYQIQVEHALDLRDCERILLIDADQSLQQAYRFYPLSARQETSYTTHGITPSTLLYIYHQLFNEAAPPATMLAIQASRFELGQGLSQQASNNLQLALEFISNVLGAEDFSRWDSQKSGPLNRS
jgi:hydrogenase maturation protease